MNGTVLQPETVGTADIFTRIRDVLPLIRARRREIEQARCMPRDLMEQLARTGMFRLGVPRDLGGEQARPMDLMAAVELVSTADGSAGWCAMIATANGATAGYLADSGARQMFADPAAPTAGIAAPMGAAVHVNGGARVTGRWQFASGITHSDWVWAGCIVMENGQPRMTAAGPEIIHVCLPCSEIEIHDTWHVSGLSGTGSNDFTVTDVFVPADRIFLLLDPSAHRPEPLYQIPALGLFVYQLACVSLGIARAALDELVELAQSKVPTMHMAPLADKPVTQIELARAEAQHASARAFLYRVVEDIWNTVSAHVVPTPYQLAAGRMAAMFAVEAGAHATRTANVLAGGSAIYTHTSLQRHARDAEAILHHFTVAPHVWEDAGRVLLGRPPLAAVF